MEGITDYKGTHLVFLCSEWLKEKMYNVSICQELYIKNFCNISYFLLTGSEICFIYLCLNVSTALLWSKLMGSTYFSPGFLL